MYNNISDGVRPGGKYISRNSQKGVLSNGVIILRHIMMSACVAMCKACCLNRYTNVWGLCSVDSEEYPWGYLCVYCSDRSRTAYGESPDT